MFKYILISICIISSVLFSAEADNTPEEAHIIAFLDKLFQDISEDIYEIEETVDRIAIYNIKMDRKAFNLEFSNYIEGRLHQIFQNAAGITLVNLPKMNGIKISSSDTSFHILNTVPTVNELWKIGRSLGVKAFLEGECTYIPKLGIALNLRLSKTGSGSILWAKTYTIYAKDVMPKDLKPATSFILNLGMETFRMNSLEQNDIFKEDFTGALTYHTLDLGIMQYLESMRHFRYEVRMGVAFLEKGIQLNLDKFEDNTFYAHRKISNGFPMPISFRFQTLFYMGLVEKANMEYADWVSLYVSFARHFAEKTPDFNCIGIGLRGDVSDSFSISAGISFVLASEFDSIPLKSSDDHLKLNFDGLQYHLLLIQYAF